MATTPELQTFPSVLQNAQAERTHSKKVALGIVPYADSDLTMTITMLEAGTTAGQTKVTVDALNLTAENFVFITGTGICDGMWKASAIAALAFDINLPFTETATGKAHPLADISFIKQAEAVNGDETADSDTWGTIGTYDQTEFDNTTHTCSVNAYRDLSLTEVSAIMGIDDPVQTPVNLTNAGMVHLITMYYDGRTSSAKMHSYSVKENVTWLTNPKTIAFDDYAMWEVTGEAARGYSRQVYQETVVTTMAAAPKKAAKVSK